MFPAIVHWGCDVAFHPMWYHSLHWVFLLATNLADKYLEGRSRKVGMVICKIECHRVAPVFCDADDSAAVLMVLMPLQMKNTAQCIAFELLPYIPYMMKGANERERCLLNYFGLAALPSGSLRRCCLVHPTGGVCVNSTLEEEISTTRSHCMNR